MMDVKARIQAAQLSELTALLSVALALLALFYKTYNVFSSKFRISNLIENLEQESDSARAGFLKQTFASDEGYIPKVTVKLVKLNGSFVQVFSVKGKDVGYLPAPKETTSQYTEECAVPGSTVYPVKDTAAKHLIEFLSESGIFMGFGCRIDYEGHTLLVSAGHVHNKSTFVRKLGTEKVYRLPVPHTIFNDVVLYVVHKDVMSNFGFKAKKCVPLVAGVKNIVSVFDGTVGIAYGEIESPKNDRKDPFDFEHRITTDNGVSGSPIMDRAGNVVGIHCGGWRKLEKNLATALWPLLRASFPLQQEPEFELESPKRPGTEYFPEEEFREFVEKVELRLLEKKNLRTVRLDNDFTIVFDGSSYTIVADNQYESWADYSEDEYEDNESEPGYEFENADFHHSPTQREVNLSGKPLINLQYFRKEETLTQELKSPASPKLKESLPCPPKVGLNKSLSQSQRKQEKPSPNLMVLNSLASPIPKESGRVSLLQSDTTHAKDPKEKVIRKRTRRRARGSQKSLIQSHQKNSENSSQKQSIKLNQPRPQDSLSLKDIQLIKSLLAKLEGNSKT
jgi:hypothetical protein